MRSAAFDPEEIRFLKEVLDDAVAALPVQLRTSATRAVLAHNILTQAAQGERDPIRLRTLALVECGHVKGLSPCDPFDSPFAR